jgi:carbamoyl-phosphate synthase large subunit
MFNILVTGVGSIIGYGIIDGLRKSSVPTTITGIDIYEDAYGAERADHFVQGVRADSPGFIDFINGVITKHNIDLVIPGIEQDLYQLWEHREIVKAKVVFGNELCMQMARNKLFTFEFLKDKGIILIPTLHNCSFSECASQLGLPFLLKPILSSASKGIEKISTEEEFEFYTKKTGGECIYQQIVGSMEEEYTACVFGDGSGHISDCIILQRKLSGEGATSKAVYTDDKQLRDYIEVLCTILKPVGPLNIQLRRHNGIPYLLEINSRVSSSCSIRTLMGYNEPEMCVRYYLKGEKIVPAPRIPGRVVRYIADYFIAT